MVTSAKPDLALSPMERLLRAYARYAPINLGKYRLVNALWRKFAGDNHQRDAKLLYGNFRIECDLDELIQRQLHFFGTYFLERESLDVWQSMSRTSETIFDIGANAGIYSLASLAANPKAVVHAFEPTPEIAGRLRRTKERNNLASLVIAEVALSDHEGHGRLVRYDGGGGNGGMNYIVSPTDGDQRELVTMTSLDVYCRLNQLEQIDLVKIDVQGLEPQVIRGASGLLREGRIGTIFMELNWAPPGQECAAEAAVKLLSDFGFHFAAIGHSPEWRKPGPWLRSHADIMACRAG